VSSSIRTIVKKAVRVVSSPQSGDSQTPHVSMRLGPGPEAPVLGHRAGIDKVDYGSPDFPDCRDEKKYSVVVNGRTYKVFFLCGHPRSGTHWMDGVLNLHPKIWIDGEYRFESLHNSLNDFTGKSWHAGSNEPMRSTAIQCFHRTVKDVVGSSCANRPGALWLGDRTPRPTRCFVPGSPHFLIIRDPRDVIVSWAHQEIKNGGFNYVEGGFDAYFHDIRAQFLADATFFKKNPELLLGHEPWLRRLVWRCRRHMRVDLECLKLIDEGKTSGGIAGGASRCHVVRYENIHKDPEGERNKLYRFLGLDPAEAGPLSDETKTKPRLAEENPHGLYRRGEVGDWVKHFTPEVKAWFKDEAADLLVELGYEKDVNW
jgi:hypothetical protein